MLPLTKAILQFLIRGTSFFYLTDAATSGVKPRACAILCCNLRCATLARTTAWQGWNLRQVLLRSAFRNCLFRPYTRPRAFGSFRILCILKKSGENNLLRATPPLQRMLPFHQQFFKSIHVFRFLSLVESMSESTAAVAFFYAPSGE